MGSSIRLRKASLALLIVIALLVAPIILIPSAGLAAGPSPGATPSGPPSPAPTAGQPGPAESRAPVQSPVLEPKQVESDEASVSGQYGMKLGQSGTGTGYQWKDLQGPGNGDAHSLAYDSARSILYRGTSTRGICKYQSNQWTPLAFPAASPDVEFSSVWALAYDQTANTLYASVYTYLIHGGEPAIYRITDPDTNPVWTGIAARSAIEAPYSLELTGTGGSSVLFAGGSSGIFCSQNPEVASPAWTNITSGTPTDGWYAWDLEYDTSRSMLYAFLYKTASGGGYQLRGQLWRCDTPLGSFSWNLRFLTVPGADESYLYLELDETNDRLYTFISVPLSYPANNRFHRIDNPSGTPVYNQLSGGPTSVGTWDMYRYCYDPVADNLYASTGSNAVDGYIYRFEDVGTGTGTWKDLPPEIVSAHDHFNFESLLYVPGATPLLFCGADGYAGVMRCNDPAAASPSQTILTGYVSTAVIFSSAWDSAGGKLYAGLAWNQGRCGVWRLDTALNDPPDPSGWTDLTPTISNTFSPYCVPAMVFDGSSPTNRLYAAASDTTSTGGHSVYRFDNPESPPPLTPTQLPTAVIGSSVVHSLAYDGTHDTLYAGCYNLYGQAVYRCDNASGVGGSPAWSLVGGNVAGADVTVSSLVYDQVHDSVYAAFYNEDAASGIGIWRCSNPRAVTPTWANMSAGSGPATPYVSSMLMDPARGLLYAQCPVGQLWRCATPAGAPGWAQISWTQDGCTSYNGALNVIHQGGYEYWRVTGPQSTPLTDYYGGNLDDTGIYQNTLSDDTGDSYLFTGSYQGIFRARYGAIISCAANQARQDTTLNVNITGNAFTNFVAGHSEAWFISADLSRFLTVNSTTVTGAQSATANITIARDAPVGLYHLGVITDLEHPVPLNSGFTVLYQPPRVDAVNPNTAQNAGPVNVTIAGDYFRAGASAKLHGPGLPDINGTSVNVASSAQMACNFDVTAKPPGVYDLTVTNDDGQSSTLARAFTVTKATCPTWYLAEGTSAWGFTTYITIENPNPEQCTAAITYNTSSGAKNAPDVILPPSSQTTVFPEQVVPDQDFSTVVTCKEGKTIAVDRTMTWRGQGAKSAEAHTSVGVPAPANTWYLAEGSSEWGFECWLLIQNPSGTDTTARVTYMIEGSGPKTVDHQIPANSRKTFNMETDIGKKDASIKVESTVPVIPERAMYRNNRREGHDSIGTVAPATDYFLAEGTTAWGFTTYVLVQNPQGTATDVTVTYMTPSGPKVQPTISIPPNSRKTIRVNDIADVSNTDLSTKVHGSAPIIAERAMYWGAAGSLGEACHDSIGMASAHTTFYLPDGQTSEGRETWTLVQNPNNSDITVEISYLGAGGTGNQSFTDTVPANSRKTYNIADKIPSGRASVMVTSQSLPIMVERAMYWSNRGAGTDTIGGYSD